MNLDENAQVVPSSDEDATRKVPARKLSWNEIFALFDAADVPEDFLTERPLEPSREREIL